MRLDHLLSTENTVRCFSDSENRTGVTVTLLMRMLVWKRSLSWMPQGVRKLCGYAFGLPDRHPTVLDCGAVRCPSSSAWFPFGVSGEGGGAWWFENWIVDASKRNVIVSFCLSRFRQTLYCFEFGFEIDRFVIIFSVMICRLAILLSGNLRAGQWFLLLCRLQGRMVDALADSTDEGRLRMR